MNESEIKEIVLVQNLITKKEKYYKIIGENIVPTSKTNFKERKKTLKLYYSKTHNNKFDINIYTKNTNPKGELFIADDRKFNLINNIENIFEETEYKNIVTPITRKIEKEKFEGYYIEIFNSHIGISAQLVNDLEISIDYKLKMFFGENHQELFLNFFDFDCKESSFSMGLTEFSRTGINSMEFPIVIYLKNTNSYLKFEDLIGQKLKVDIEPDTINGEPWYYVYLD